MMGAWRAFDALLNSQCAFRSFPSKVVQSRAHHLDGWFFYRCRGFWFCVTGFKRPFLGKVRINWPYIRST
jgi:hypothetical protein